MPLGNPSLPVYTSFNGKLSFFFFLENFKRIVTLSVDKQIDQTFTSTMGTDKRFRLY